MTARKATRKVARRRTQAERTATSERAMLRAARALIATQGYTKTSLAQIGKRAGYTGGLVGHHFGSKLGLLRRLIEDVGSRFSSDQMEAATKGREGLTALCAVADAYLEELVLREEAVRALYVLMGEALGPVPEINPMFVELNRFYLEQVRSLVEQGIELGEIRADIDPEAEAALLVGMARGIALQRIEDPDCFDLDAVRASVQTAIRRHLARLGEAP